MFSSGSGSSTTAAFDGVLKQFEEDDAFARDFAAQVDKTVGQMNKIARPRKDFTEVFRPAAMEQRKKRVKTDLDRMLEHETAELQELDDELDKVREEYDHAKEELEQLRAGARSELFELPPAAREDNESVREAMERAELRLLAERTRFIELKEFIWADDKENNAEMGEQDEQMIE